MVREMVASDWTRVAEIYKQGLEGGTATFNTVCPSLTESPFLRQDDYPVYAATVPGFSLIAAGLVLGF